MRAETVVVCLAWAGAIIVSCGSDSSSTTTSGSVSTTGAGATAAGAGGTTTGSGGGTGSGTGGSADAGLPDPPAIDPNTDVTLLTTDQRMQLCDWVNAALGGYGMMTNCPNTTSVQTDPDQAACVARGFMYRCMVTAGQVVGCVQARAPSKGCEIPFDKCHDLLCQ